MNPVPIMLVGDHPSLDTGLARITRDLATLLAGNPRFRVAVCGFGGIGSRRLPFHCYTMQGMVEYFTWPRSVMMSWEDWSRGEPGIIFTVWDLSRLLWMAQPKYLEGQDDVLFNWARNRNFRLWSYLPIDSTGPNGKLTSMSRETLLGIDRLLAMTPFGEREVRATIGDLESDRRGLFWLPHGLGEVWQPESKDRVVNEVPRIGVVATNQPRKDWGLVAEIAHQMPKTRWWWHVDKLVAHWSIEALLEDFELRDRVEVTHELSDPTMCACYQTCDLTIAPGLGEGFGYPIFESLACGVPVLHLDYAGGASILETLNLDYPWAIEPAEWRLDGQHNSLRPVSYPEQWLGPIQAVIEEPFARPNIDHLRWRNLAPLWTRWFNEGVQ